MIETKRNRGTTEVSIGGSLVCLIREMEITWFKIKELKSEDIREIKRIAYTR